MTSRDMGGNPGTILQAYPDSKVHGANMGPIWGRQDPGGPHVGPINFAIWVSTHLWAGAVHSRQYTSLYNL